MILNTTLLEVVGDDREECGLGRLPLWYKYENDNLQFSNEYNDDILNEIAFEIAFERTSALEQEDYYDDTDEDPVGIPYSNALSDVDSTLFMGGYCDANSELDVELWLAA